MRVLEASPRISMAEIHYKSTQLTDAFQDRLMCSRSISDLEMNKPQEQAAALNVALDVALDVVLDVALDVACCVSAYDRCATKMWSAGGSSSTGGLQTHGFLCRIITYFTKIVFRLQKS